MPEKLVKVEADIYSGVANPCQDIRLKVLLENFKHFALDQIEDDLPQPPSLGYRGIIIHYPQRFGGHTRVFNGYYCNNAGCWLDRDRLFESWLLDVLSDGLGDTSLKLEALKHE